MELVASTAASSTATCVETSSVVDAEDILTGVPYVGMEFESDEDGRIFYNEYAWRMGFGTRIGHSYCSRKDRKTVISRTFECVKAGFREGEGKTISRRKTPSLRVGCKAMIMLKKREFGKWVLSKFEKEHCHDLAPPSKVHLFRSHSHRNTPTKNLVNSSAEAGVPSRPLMPIFIEESGGANNVGFITKDCRNVLRAERMRTFGNDGQILLEYFQRKQAENPTFFYAIQVDEDQCLANVFWVDARSRMAYDYFGDVVTFDTTYKANPFKMPFAPFTGMNHHRQPVLFGCALLSDDTEASFIWLFETWLVAMSGRHPISILTDHDEAVTAAVKHVFPKTNHRFCMRHIQKKKQEKLSHVINKHKDFEDAFHKCIYQSETSDEFETSWQLLLEKYDLNDNDWLKSLYDVRQKWIPLYLKDQFFADLSTPQRNESTSAFFDGYVSSRITFQAFVEQYEKALVSHYEKELEADFDSSYTKLNLSSPSPMEIQAADIYTRKVFARFQEEFVETWHYVAKKCDEVIGGISTYRVTRFGQANKSYDVTFVTSDGKANCSCKMFEFSGILCRHVLLVFRMEGVFEIPSHYILTRWTKNAKRGVVNQSITQPPSNSYETLLTRFNNLCLEAVKLAEEGSSSIPLFNYALSILQESKKNIIVARNFFEQNEKSGK